MGYGNPPPDDVMCGLLARCLGAAVIAILLAVLWVLA